MNIYRLVKYKNKASTMTKYFNTNFNIIELNVDDINSTTDFLCNILNINNLEIITTYKKIKKNKEMFITLLLLIYSSENCIVINNKITLNFDEITDLYKYDLITVKSCVNEKLFNGFIYSKKNNTDILPLIDKFVTSNDETVNLNDMFYEMIKLSNNKMNSMLNEKIIGNISEIYFNNKIIGTHYFTLLSLDLLNINKHFPSDLNKLKIGITFMPPKDINGLYSNGINQNALYLFELLKNIGYNPKLIIETNKETQFKEILNNINFYKYEYSLLENIHSDNFDLVFTFSFSLTKDIVYILKSFGTKIVKYSCGNSYLIESEAILYSQHPSRNNFDEYIYNNSLEIADQIWSIPQMYTQNKYYWEILHRTKCIEVPFIWSSNSINFIKMVNNKSENDIKCVKKNNKIAIFEPNLSVMKWCLPCLLICEKNYRTYKNIEHIFVTNMDISKVNDSKFDNNNLNINLFNKFCINLDILKDKKFTCEKRYNSINFMTNYAYIAISHQWENPLNYLYLDLAWLGWPILHNAHLCKDIGYYYDGFNYEEASEKLNSIMNNHEANIDEYILKNRKLINIYLPTNVELQQKYKNLITNLFTK